MPSSLNQFMVSELRLSDRSINAFFGPWRAQCNGTGTQRSRFMISPEHVEVKRMGKAPAGSSSALCENGVIHSRYGASDTLSARSFARIYGLTVDLHHRARA